MTFVNSRINAAGYQQMLHDYLLPFITLTKNDKTIFQQNNVPIHYFLQKMISRFRDRVIMASTEL